MLCAFISPSRMEMTAIFCNSLEHKELFGTAFFKTELTTKVVCNPTIEKWRAVFSSVVPVFGSKMNTRQRSEQGIKRHTACGKAAIHCSAGCDPFLEPGMATDGKDYISVNTLGFSCHERNKFSSYKYSN